MIIIIKVIIKCKILSVGTILSAHPHTYTHTNTHIHEHTDCKTEFTYNLNGQQTGIWGKWRQQCGTENMAGLLFGEKKCLEVWLEGVQRGFLSERRGNVIPCRGAKEKAQEPAVANMVQGAWRLRVEAEQEGHHITDHLEERGVERGSTRRSSLKGRRQSDEHFNCFKGNDGGTSERQGGAYGLFWARRYNLDLNCMHLRCLIHEQKFGSLFVLRQQLMYTCVQSHCYTHIHNMLFYS